MPGPHSEKQRRQARHVADSERRRGKSPDEAERIGWATVNARRKGMKKDMSEYSHTVGMPPIVATKPPSGFGKQPHAVTPPSAPAAAPKTTVPKPAAPKTGAPRVAMKGRNKSKMKKDEFAGLPGGEAYAAMGKSKVRIVSIAEARAMLAKNINSGGGPAQPRQPIHPATPAQPKKFPRREKKTVKMKPITDEEAMANLKAGKYIEKHVAELFAMLRSKGFDVQTSLDAIKALSAGYSRVSGGGALRAPNRGWGTIEELQRAVAAPPPLPAAAKPKVFLPGVHSVSVKPKYGDAAHKILGFPKKKTKSAGTETIIASKRKGKLKKMVPTINASVRPSVVSKKSPRAVDSGGAALLANALGDPTLRKSENVVHNSGGDATMSKTDFNDLFKSELGTDVLCDCPHCEEPITKADLAKARHNAHGGKGKKTKMTGPAMVHIEGGEQVAKQNPHGGAMRGGQGEGVHYSSRGVPGAKKVDEVHVQSTTRASRKNAASYQENTPTKKLPPIAKGKIGHTKDDHAESIDDSSAYGEDESSFDAASEGGREHPRGKHHRKAEGEPDVKKAIVRGTEFVQYMDYNGAPGSDAAIAKAIAEGMLGGTQPTQPLDLNNDLTRLLI